VQCQDFFPVSAVDADGNLVRLVSAFCCCKCHDAHRNFCEPLPRPSNVEHLYLTQREGETCIDIGKQFSVDVSSLVLLNDQWYPRLQRNSLFKRGSIVQLASRSGAGASVQRLQKPSGDPEVQDGMRENDQGTGNAASGSLASLKSTSSKPCSPVKKKGYSAGEHGLNKVTKKQRLVANGNGFSISLQNSLQHDADVAHGQGFGRFFVRVKEEWRSQRGFEVFEVKKEHSKEDEWTAGGLVCLSCREWFCASSVAPPNGFKDGHLGFLPKTISWRKREFLADSLVEVVPIQKEIDGLGTDGRLRQKKHFIEIQNQIQMVDLAYSQL